MAASFRKPLFSTGRRVLCVSRQWRHSILASRELPVPSENSSGVRHNTLRPFVSTTVAPSPSSSPPSGTDHHAFFQEQLQELEHERKSLFGSNNESDDDIMLDDLAKRGSATIPSSGQGSQPEDMTSVETSLENSESMGETMADLEDLHAERDALFQFSQEERDAWGGGTHSDTISADLLRKIEEARRAVESRETDTVEKSSPPPASPAAAHSHHEAFSHVSPDGDSVHMVDVGHKKVTTRTARAQSKVILPPEVLEAFRLSSNSSELVGPKGPIFATAKLAGILAAKKTSDLIPLCHPLPLDQVQVEISLSGSEVVIDCTCRVTHKTGVEMEALTGASVAALTIYDMVKAVSHQVEITDTKLVSKTGGKRTVDNGHGVSA